MLGFFKNDLGSNIFILSSPRSGTTWLSKMLNAHPEIFCTENRLFGEYADLIQDDNASNPRLRITLDKYIQSISLHENVEDLKMTRVEYRNKLMTVLVNALSDFHSKESGKKLLIDKITPYIGTSDLVAQKIHKFYPSSRIIFLVRDGRDVCTSGIFHWLKKRPLQTEYSEFEILRRKFFIENEDVKLDSFFLQSEIKEWAETWTESLRIIPYLTENHQILIIRYENMLENTKDVLRNVLNFLKVNHSESIISACSEAGRFSKMSGGRRKGGNEAGAHIRKGESGDWKNYFTKNNLRLFNNIAGEELLKFGYH